MRLRGISCERKNGRYYICRQVIGVHGYASRRYSCTTAQEAVSLMQLALEITKDEDIDGKAN